MAEQMKPASPQQAPDPSDSYERSHPGHEAGMGSLDTNRHATPHNAPDQSEQATTNRQDAARQVNGQDVTDQRSIPAPEQPDHSMKDEEPDGWDLAPNDIHDPRQKRHPRTEGRGGTP